MYSIYKYNSGATQANVLLDIVAILTGETTVANLSASCDKPNTTITSAIAAGWTLHDGSAGSNKKVIKSAYSDNGSAFKYVEIDLSSSSYIKLYTYETFDSGTHTGTNKSGDISYYQRFSTSENNTINIFSSSKHIVLYAGYSNNTSWGDSSYGGCYLLAEMTRLSAWNTVASGFPSFMLSYTGYENSSSSYYCSYFTRVKNNVNTILSGSNATGKMYSLGSISGMWSYFPSGSTAVVYDENSNQKIPFYSIYFGRYDYYAAPLGEISSLCDIWLSPINILNVFDNVTNNSITYRAIPLRSGSYPQILVRKS